MTFSKFMAMARPYLHPVLPIYAGVIYIYRPAPCGFAAFIVCKASSPATPAAACWAVTSAISLLCVGVPPLFDAKTQAARLVGASLSVDMGLCFECKPCGTVLLAPVRRRRALSDTDQPVFSPFSCSIAPCVHKVRPPAAAFALGCCLLSAPMTAAVVRIPACSMVPYRATLWRVEQVSSLRRRRQSLDIPVNFTVWTPRLHLQRRIALVPAAVV